MISVAGPLGMGGLSDSGDYSIENNIKRCVELTKTRVFSQLIEDPKKQIYILIKGHSRSAVAVSQISVQLATVFAPFPNTQISFTQFDPVPGPFHCGIDSEIDYGKQLDKNVLSRLNSTVLYSMKTEHNSFFTPQAVYNANKVILLNEKHDMGLNKSKKFEVNNKIYHGSSLTLLPNGIYTQENSESEKDIKLKKQTDYKPVADLVKKKGNFFQRRRTNILLDVLKKKMTGKGYEESDKNIDTPSEKNIQNSSENSNTNIDNSSEENIQNSFENLNNHNRNPSKKRTNTFWGDVFNKIRFNPRDLSKKFLKNSGNQNGDNSKKIDDTSEKNTKSFLGDLFNKIKSCFRKPTNN